MAVENIRRNIITMVLGNNSETVSIDLGVLSNITFDAQKAYNIVKVLENYFYKPLQTVLYTKKSIISRS